MSFVGSASATTASTASSVTIAYTGSAIQVGDLIAVLVIQDAGGSTTISNPTTPGAPWTSGGSLTPAIPDALIGSSVQTHAAFKIAASGDAGTPSYTFTSNYPGDIVAQMRVYRGRASTISAALNNSAITAIGAAANTPYSYPLTGLTVLAGDDVVSFVGAAVSAGGPPTAVSAPITGFANELDTVSSASSFSPFMISEDQVNASAGTVASFAETITTTPVTQIAPYGFVLSIPAASAAAPKPVLSGGKVLVSGGHVVTGAMFMPLAWAINRRNKRAAERRAVRDTLKRGR